MADTKVLQFLDLTGLGQYDAKIKAYVDAADAKGLKGVALNGNKLLFYTELPIEGATAAYDIELPETDLSGVIAKFEAATAGNIIVVAEDGKTIVDSGKSFNDLATKDEVEAAQTAADAAMAKAEALEALVGVIPDGYEAETIVAYIQEVAANIVANGYDDAALQARVKATEDAITTLNGDTTVEGSVDYKVAQEIAKIVADAPESLNDLKEIATWITTHETDAASMNQSIQDNKTALDALKAYVGTLPEGATATTVVDYIAEALENADLSKYALASDLTAAIERIAANEQAIAVINAALAEGGTTFEAIKNAQETGDNAQTAVDTLATYVGTFAVDDESVKTIVDYINYKVDKVSADIEERLKAVEDAVATKAEQEDLDELAGRVTTAEGKIDTNVTNIEALQAAIDGISSIPETDINALFE